MRKMCVFQKYAHTHIFCVRKGESAEICAGSALSAFCPCCSPALGMDSESKIAQEKASLRRVPDFFKKIIVTGGYMKPRIDEDGIIRVGIINFLMDDRLLS